MIKNSVRSDCKRAWIFRAVAVYIYYFSNLHMCCLNIKLPRWCRRCPGRSVGADPLLRGFSKGLPRVFQGASVVVVSDHSGHSGAFQGHHSAGPSTQTPARAVSDTDTAALDEVQRRPATSFAQQGKLQSRSDLDSIEKIYQRLQCIRHNTSSTKTQLAY